MDCLQPWLVSLCCQAAETSKIGIDGLDDLGRLFAKVVEFVKSEKNGLPPLKEENLSASPGTSWSFSGSRSQILGTFETTN